MTLAPESEELEILLSNLLQSAEAKQPKVVLFEVSQSISFDVTVMPSPPVMVAVRTPLTLVKMVPSVRSVKRSLFINSEPTPCMPVVVALPVKVEEAWEMKPLPKMSVVEVELPSAVGVKGKDPPAPVESVPQENTPVVEDFTSQLLPLRPETMREVEEAMPPTERLVVVALVVVEVMTVSWVMVELAEAIIL